MKTVISRKDIKRFVIEETMRVLREEGDPTLPRYRDSEGNEWIHDGNILRLCSTRSCKMMRATPENLANLECIANCPGPEGDLQEPAPEQPLREAEIDPEHVLDKEEFQNDCPNGDELGRWLATAGDAQNIAGFIGTEFPTRVNIGGRFLHRYKTAEAASKAKEYILSATGGHPSAPGRGEQEYIVCLKRFGLKLEPEIDGTAVTVHLVAAGGQPVAPATPPR